MRKDALTRNLLVVLVVADEVGSDDEESGHLRRNQALHRRILPGLHLTAFGHNAEPACRIANNMSISAFTPLKYLRLTLSPW